VKNSPLWKKGNNASSCEKTYELETGNKEGRKGSKPTNLHGKGGACGVRKVGRGGETAPFYYLDSRRLAKKEAIFENPSFRIKGWSGGQRKKKPTRSRRKRKVDGTWYGGKLEGRRDKGDTLEAQRGGWGLKKITSKTTAYIKRWGRRDTRPSGKAPRAGAVSGGEQKARRPTPR